MRIMVIRYRSPLPRAKLPTKYLITMMRMDQRWR